MKDTLKVWPFSFVWGVAFSSLMFGLIFILAVHHPDVSMTARFFLVLFFGLGAIAILTVPTFMGYFKTLHWRSLVASLQNDAKYHL